MVPGSPFFFSNAIRNCLSLFKSSRPLASAILTVSKTTCKSGTARMMTSSLWPLSKEIKTGDLNEYLNFCFEYDQRDE